MNDEFEKLNKPQPPARPKPLPFDYTPPEPELLEELPAAPQPELESEPPAWQAFAPPRSVLLPEPSKEVVAAPASEQEEPTAPQQEPESELPPPAWQAFAPPEDELLNWEAPPPVVPPPLIIPAPKAPFALNKTPDELWQQDLDEGLPELELEETPPKKKDPPEKKNMKNTKSRKKKKGPVRRILRRIFLVVLALVLLIGTMAFFAAGRMNIESLDTETRARTQAPSSSALVTTILLIGIDEPMPRGRADTLMLLSIDHRTLSLRLTSILRDSWVRFPGGTERKINEVTVGRNGGGPLAMRVVSENFNIRVDHYIMLHFDAFETIIDAIGGISVPITPAEINALVNDTRLGRQIGRSSMERQMRENGVVRLNGEQALIYARIRRRDTDMDRARRNREVIDAVVSRVRTQPWRLLPLAFSALPELYTSMPQWRTALLAMGAPVYLFYSMETHQVPAQGTFRNARRGGLFVFELDIAANRRLLREFIYG